MKRVSYLLFAPICVLAMDPGVKYKGVAIVPQKSVVSPKDIGEIALLMDKRGFFVKERNNPKLHRVPLHNTDKVLRGVHTRKALRCLAKEGAFFVNRDSNNDYKVDLKLPLKGGIDPITASILIGFGKAAAEAIIYAGIAYCAQKTIEGVSGKKPSVSKGVMGAGVAIAGGEVCKNIRGTIGGGQSGTTFNATITNNLNKGGAAFLSGAGYGEECALACMAGLSEGFTPGTISAAFDWLEQILLAL